MSASIRHEAISPKTEASISILLSDVTLSRHGEPMRFIVSLLLLLFVLIPRAGEGPDGGRFALFLRWTCPIHGSRRAGAPAGRLRGGVPFDHIHDAIREGVHGRIAFVYLEWANTLSRIAIPWTVIDGPKTARDFADRLSRSPIWQERDVDFRSHRCQRQASRREQGRTRSAGDRHLRRWSQQSGASSPGSTRRGSGKGDHDQRAAADAVAAE